MLFILRELKKVGEVEAERGIRRRWLRENIGAPNEMSFELKNVRKVRCRAENYSSWRQERSFNALFKSLLTCRGSGSSVDKVC